VRILRADNGSEVTFGELMRTGERPLAWALDERGRMVARPMIDVVPRRRCEVFTLRLAPGVQTAQLLIGVEDELDRSVVAVNFRLGMSQIRRGRAP
jgi:hypothetical protein